LITFARAFVARPELLISTKPPVRNQSRMQNSAVDSRTIVGHVVYAVSEQ